MSELNCRKLSWCQRIAGWGPPTPHIWCQKCGECGSGVRVRRKHRRKTSMDNTTASAVRGHQGLPSQGRQSSGCSLSCKRKRIQSYFHAKRLTDIPGRNPVYLKVRCSNKVTPTSFLNKGSCQPPNPRHRPGTVDVAHCGQHTVGIQVTILPGPASYPGESPPPTVGPRAPLFGLPAKPGEGLRNSLPTLFPSADVSAEASQL